MRRVKLFMDGKLVIENCGVATSFLDRLCGLMGKKNIRPDEALYFPSCNSIHTFFMRFPIDVVFINKDGTAVEIIEALRANRCLAPRWRAKNTLEMRAYRCRELGIVAGSRFQGEGLGFEI
ncbi:MAG: DUF192 domain-containing protein [Deltaproteobacteria bacterium]|nr:DUF192 domain-containing protein [Deltaproteobacteria bacterium]